ncbi:hypothetical protein IPV69_03135 [Humisphaera borealis]|uniref:CARDB domain-containing protein n=2 Tax=Humisphaera borealis TaxID=2807512 RepID=A0A7M2WXX0_9BACT|nr:hypothetical protein IPV69_03135 [Humisphaera borealis]
MTARCPERTASRFRLWVLVTCLSPGDRLSVADLGIAPSAGPGGRMSAMQSTVPRVRPQTIVAEVLEPRALFSVSEVAPVEVNLSASDLTVVAPPAVIIGQKFKAGVSLAVGNAGTTAVATRGTIELFLSQDHDLSSDDTVFSTVTPKLNLKPGQQRVVKVAITSLPSVPNGQYHVIARLSAGTNKVETDAADNIAANVNVHIDVAQPRIDLSGGFGLTPTTARPGKTLAVELSVFNSANITATGKLSVLVSATTDKLADPVGTPLGIGKVTIKVPPDEIRTYRLRVRVPASLPPGSYYLLGSVDSAAAFTESNESNNSFPGYTLIQIG